MAVNKKTRAGKSKSLNRSRFSSRQLALFVAVFAVVGGIVIWRSLAAPANGGGNKGTTSTPLHLVNEYTQWGGFGNNGCLTEDDFHERDYSGALNGKFDATDQLCELNVNGATSGGIGLRAEAWVTGSLTDMTITAPTGVVHHAVLVGSSTYKHVTTNHYQTCFVPAYYISTDTGVGTLSGSFPGNPWTYSISGNFSNASYKIYGHMTDVSIQQTYCPASEQNLL